MSQPVTITLKASQISSTNPALTAAAIQQAFLAATTDDPDAPISSAMRRRTSGCSARRRRSRSSVTSATTASDPNGLRTFDITFTDSYEDLPSLVPWRGTAAVLSGSTVVIKKESSPEFRVNPEVPVRPFQHSSLRLFRSVRGDGRRRQFRDHLDGRCLRSGEQRQRHRHLRSAVRAGGNGFLERSGPVGSGHEQRRRPRHAHSGRPAGGDSHPLQFPVAHGPPGAGRRLHVPREHQHDQRPGPIVGRHGPGGKLRRRLGKHRADHPASSTASRRSNSVTTERPSAAKSWSTTR